MVYWFTQIISHFSIGQLSLRVKPLDVYKRQTLGILELNAYPLLDSMAVQFIACLLYTSRCV